MSDESSSPEPIVLDCELDEPPEKVFRALTDADIIDEWLVPEPHGATRTLLEARPNSIVRYGWQSECEGGVVDSVVTFTITATPSGGTRLILVHGDFTVRQSDPVMMRRAA